MRLLRPTIEEWEVDRVVRQRLDARDSAKCASIVRNAAQMMGWRWTDDLTAPACIQWTRRLSEQGLSGATVRNRLSVIRSLGRYLVAIGEWKQSPLRDVQAPRVRASDRGEGAYPFSPEEVTRLIRAARAAEEASYNARRFGACRSTLYRALWDTGLRYGEAMRLQVRYVDLDRLWITVKDDKAGRGDRIPISESLASVLADWISERELEPRDRLFLKVSHRTLVKDMHRAGIPRYVGEAGGQWHRFRKGIVTHYLRSGVDVKVVQRLARHASAKTTLDHYYRITDEALRAPIDSGLGSA